MNIDTIAYYTRRYSLMDKETAPNGVIVESLNALMKRYATHFPDEFITETTSTFASADSSMALPADLQMFVEFRIGSYIYLLIPESKRRYMDASSKVCWIREGTLYWNPAVSIGDTYKLRYYKEPTEITAMTDIPEIPEEYHRDLAVLLAWDLVAEPSRKLAADYADVSLRFKRRPQLAYRNDYMGTIYDYEGDKYTDI